MSITILSKGKILAKVISVLLCFLLLGLLPSLASARVSVNDHWVEIHQNAADTQEVTIGVTADLNGLEGQKKVG